MDTVWTGFTVRDLVNYLKTFPPDLEVMVGHGEGMVAHIKEIDREEGDVSAWVELKI